MSLRFALMSFAAATGLALAGAFGAISLTGSGGDPLSPETDDFGNPLGWTPPPEPRTHLVVISDADRFQADIGRVMIIDGEEAPLDADKLWDRIRSEPEWYFQIRYDSELNDYLESMLYIQPGGFVQAKIVLPWDVDVMYPILEAGGVPLEVGHHIILDGKPSRTPQAALKVFGEELLLAEGMHYEEIDSGGVIGSGVPYPLTMVWYESEPGAPKVSGVLYDGEGSVLVSEVLPEDEDDFAPILAAVGPQGADDDRTTKVFIRGVEVTLPAGAGMGRVVNDPLCTPGVACTQPESYIIRKDRSFISFDETGVLGHRFSPEDASAFTELLTTLDSLTWERASE